MKQTILLLLLSCTIFVASAQGVKQEAFSEFISAKNAPYHSVIGFGNYYRVDEFNRLGEAAQRLYGLSNQDEVLDRLRVENRNLQNQNDALKSELETLRRTPPPANVTPPQVVTPKEPTEEESDDESEEVTPTTKKQKKKGKTFADWLIDNALVLILLVGGSAYYFYEKRKKTTI
jgi:hypothetical protein